MIQIIEGGDLSGALAAEIYGLCIDIDAFYIGCNGLCGNIQKSEMRSILVLSLLNIYFELEKRDLNSVDIGNLLSAAPALEGYINNCLEDIDAELSIDIDVLKGPSNSSIEMMKPGNCLFRDLGVVPYNLRFVLPSSKV